MSVWDIRCESEDFQFGNALVSLYRIKSDTAIAERELIHSHSYYELHFIHQGKHTYHIAKTDVPVSAGEMIVIKPGDTHKAVFPQEGTRFTVLSISIKLLPEGESVYSLMTESLNQASCKAIPLDGKLLYKLLDYYSLPSSYSLTELFYRKLAACEIIIGILDAIGCVGQSYNSVSKIDFDIMLETLVHNSSVPLFEIAERLGYSERQISRKIKQRYGKTFTQLRKEIK